MEHKFYTDDFERLLKEKSDEFRMYPSKRVWHSIYNNLHPGRKWPSIAISLVLISTLFFVGYWNSTAKQQNYITQKQPGGNNNLAYAITAKNNTAVLPYGYSDVFGSGNAQAVEYSNAAALIQSLKSGNKNIEIIAYNTAAGIPKNNLKIKAGNIKAKLNQTTNTTPAAENTTAYNNINSKKITAFADVTLNNNVAVEDNATSITEITTANMQANGSLFATAAPADSKVKAIAENKIVTAKINETVDANEENTVGATKTLAANTVSLTMQDKAWIDEYAFYNKPARKKWKGRIASEIYITPGAGYRSLTSNTNYSLVVASALTPAVVTNPNTITLNQRPGLSFEVGAGIIISAAKNIRIKAGLQANFTNYLIEVAPVNHPVSTTIMLNDINSGYPYLQSRTSSLANSSTMPGFLTTQIHNQTQQISLPVGVAVKLAGTNKLEWYAGASLQPTYIFGGKANLISADHKNYIAEPSMLRKWNVNTAFETYFHYKMNGSTLQIGPQFRYQLASTYSQQYTYTEKLYNIGMKIGLVKNF